MNIFSDIFSSCYRNNESRSFTLLIRKSAVWSGATCLQMGMGGDARLFFSHDGVQVPECFVTLELIVRLVRFSLLLSRVHTWNLWLNLLLRVFYSENVTDAT